jgi:hypothetical protein
MSQSTSQFLRSRLQLMLTSPGKLILYATILCRWPLLLIYFRRRDRELGETQRLHEARELHKSSYQQHDDPLISIVVATYNRAQILYDRVIQSVLAQTYQNFELIIVGDGCTDNTAEMVAQANDPRVRFYNLESRTQYPEKPKYRWMVAGIPPMNRGNAEAQGQWVAHLDDDEIFEPDHLEQLLRYAQKHDLEFVYSKVLQEQTPEIWKEVGQEPIIRFLQVNNCGHSTTMWRSYLNLFEYDINSWKYNLAGDQNRWDRLVLSKVKIGFLPKITTKAPLRPQTTILAHQSEDRG